MNQINQDLIKTLHQQMLDLGHNQFPDKDIHIYKVIIEDILKRKISIFNLSI
jgi:hypothetical protein